MTIFWETVLSDNILGNTILSDNILRKTVLSDNIMRINKNLTFSKYCHLKLKVTIFFILTLSLLATTFVIKTVWTQIKTDRMSALI